MTVYVSLHFHMTIYSDDDGSVLSSSLITTDTPKNGPAHDAQYEGLNMCVEESIQRGPLG